MMREDYLTKEGLSDLRDQLHDLKTVKRREIAEAIHLAKEQGDLSENAEYQQAKDEQQRIEEQIAQIEGIIKHAKVIVKSPTSEIDVGNTIKLNCDGQEKTYQIVGSNEADPRQGRISNESPMGKSLIGKKKGESIFIPTPAGGKKCSVVDIE